MQRILLTPDHNIGEMLQTLAEKHERKELLDANARFEDLDGNALDPSLTLGDYGVGSPASPTIPRCSAHCARPRRHAEMAVDSGV